MPLQLERGDEKPISDIRINSYKNYLDKKGSSSFGRVQSPTKRINIANLAALIADRHSGIEPGMISYVARLLHEETMRQLHEGKSVEALGLGTVYVGTKGSMKGENPSVADVPKFVVKFRTSKGLKLNLKDIKAGSVTNIDSVPVINVIEDMRTKKTDSEVKKGTIVKLTGKRLRVEGVDSSVGLYLDKGDGVATKVDKADILRNEPSCIEFILPSGLLVGTSYAIKIKNQAKVKNGFSKRVREGVSGVDIKVVN
ncbi:MAG: DUF4469 domain-containing protein [Treponema sp.]